MTNTNDSELQVLEKGRTSKIVTDQLISLQASRPSLHPASGSVNDSEMTNTNVSFRSLKRGGHLLGIMWSLLWDHILYGGYFLYVQVIGALSIGLRLSTQNMDPGFPLDGT